jgi:hypothetical protein
VKEISISASCQVEIVSKHSYRHSANNNLSSPVGAGIYKKSKNRRALPAVFATRKEERKNEKEENNETLYLYDILQL